MEQTFLIEYYESQNLVWVIANIRGKEVTREIVGFGNTEHINAENRVEALIKFHEKFSPDQKILKVEKPETGNPLGFTDDEIENLKAKGIELRPDSSDGKMNIVSVEPFYQEPN
jgi:hypothetical protein